MDPSRIESYLRSTCSVLDFDIGELWCARKLPGQSPMLKFVQLYTSPTYEDFHSLLIQPETTDNQDEEKHRFSPIICRSVCDGGQIVWANTRISQGLTGRSELPLNTAVGVPICSIGHDLYILVLFAVSIIGMTPHAIEYLTTVARAVTEGSNGFLSASPSSSALVKTANTEDFVGQWDIGELIKKYSTEVEFHILPMGKLQKYFDCHEALLFCDFFMDFKQRRDGKFTHKQLDSLKETKPRVRSDSTSSSNSKNWSSLIDKVTNSGGILRKSVDLDSFDAAMSSGDSVIDELGKLSEGKPGIGAENQFPSHGVFSLDLNSIEYDEGAEPEIREEYPQYLSQQTAQSTDSDDDDSDQQTSHVKSDSELAGASVLHIYAQMTYKLSQCRLNEFMIAILGMTVFESSELWLVSEKSSELLLVAAVYRKSIMRKWIASSEKMRLKIGSEGPGKIVEIGSSHWDSDYCHSNPDGNDPRKPIAKELGINTSFGVPLPGLHGICGVVMFYSTKANVQAEPLLVLLIERAVQLMAASSLESLSSSDLVEPVDKMNAFMSPLHRSQSSNTLAKWLQEETGINYFNKVQQFPGIPVNGMDFSSQTTRNHPMIDVVDYNQKLERCRSIINGKDFAALPAGLMTAEASGMLGSGDMNVHPLAASNTNPVHLTGMQQLYLQDSDNEDDDDIYIPGYTPKPPASNSKKRKAKSTTNTNHHPGFINTPIPPSNHNPQNYAMNMNLAMNVAQMNNLAATAAATMNQHQLNTTSSLALLQLVKVFGLDPIMAATAAGLEAATSNQQIRQDPEIAAAFALASIGNKLNWKNFLQGTGNENIYDGYGGIRLETDQLVNVIVSEVPDTTTTQPNKRSKVSKRHENVPKQAKGTPPADEKKTSDNPIISTSATAAIGASSSETEEKDGLLPKCKVDDCKNLVENATGQYCVSHRGMRRCRKEGCNKCAQGATNYCIAHGGGRRCTYPGCFKGARDKFFCAAHGGGKRCTIEGCSKSAVGGSNLCTAHGGGKRCQHPGCTKSSQSSTNYCVRHGGGRTCCYPSCNKVARGRTDYCAAHGGGVRCKLKGCNRLAIGPQQLCRTHSNLLRNHGVLNEGSGGSTGGDGHDDDEDDEFEEEDEEANGQQEKQSNLARNNGSIELILHARSDGVTN